MASACRLLIGEKVRFISYMSWECVENSWKMYRGGCMVLPERKGCPPQIKGREHFISRKAMNIEGLGSETIGQFYSLGLVKTLRTCTYFTTRCDSRFGTYGERSAQNIVDVVKQSCSFRFERVLFALGIRYVGRNGRQEAGIGTSFDRPYYRGDYRGLDSDRRHRQVYRSKVSLFFSDEDNLRFVERLRQYGVQMQIITEERLSERTDKLSGATIVISGTFTHHSRDEYKALIEQHGGINTQFRIQVKRHIRQARI